MCPMDLTLFPFDSQTCKLGIESYGYTSDQVTYGWSQGQREALKLHKIRLPDFRIKEAFVTSQLESYATGNYSRLYVCFVFSRSAGFCFLQLIIPSTAVVITSWVSLWMENETSFQDMISIILTITFLLFSYNEVMPRVSYLKALDIWLAVCFMIVFLSLIKLAIMKYMRQRICTVAGGAQPCPASLLGGMLPLIQFSAGQMIGGTAAAAAGGPPFSSSRNHFVGGANNDMTTRPPTPPPTMRSSFQFATNSVLSPHQRVHHQHQLQRLQQQLAPNRRSSRHAENGAGGAVMAHSRESRHSSEEDTLQQQQQQRHNRTRQQSTISQGLEMSLDGACLPQLMLAQNAGRRKGGSGSMDSAIQPYQTPIATLAAAQMHLPLNESSLRQLQQQTLYQAHQLQLQVQLHALQREQRRRERHARREQERLKPQQQQQVKRRLHNHHKDCNDNVLPPNGNGTGAGRSAQATKRSPVNAIRIGIESSSSDSSTESDAVLRRHRLRRRERRLFFGMFDEFGNVEFSASFIRRFHWVTQMSFFFFFVLFCLYFFLVYPNSRTTSTDPACKREEAEWFASIPA
uniref:Uncharacterized protein n=1 Tax=Globodera rostochiensis TaxID=31243 RepID=A0A914HC43_GLORO